MATTVSAYLATHVARPARCQEDTTPSRVRRTRDELARSAVVTSLPMSRARLVTLQSGRSKVEEVRKIFEGHSKSATFSRSFESPPRRRLADSLFASFKLPRKKPTEPVMAVSRVPTTPHNAKRKSAVELLAESKAYYVKSETVLDRKQELPIRAGVMNGGSNSTSYHAGLSTALRQLLNSDSRSAVRERRSAWLSGNEHRSKPEYRRNTYSFHDNYQFSDVQLPIQPSSTIHHSHDANSGRVPSVYDCRSMEVEEPVLDYSWGTTSLEQNEVRYFGYHCEKDDYRVDVSNEAEMFPPPEEFQEPDVKSSHHSMNMFDSYDESTSGVGMDYGTISPPEQYAPTSCTGTSATNINSHKSLPDLHKHSSRRRRTISCSSRANSGQSRVSLVSSCEAFSEHSRHTEHHSRWVDSGGSSGHTTHHSAPHPNRRDSLDVWAGEYQLPPPQFQDAPAPITDRYNDDIPDSEAIYHQMTAGPTSPLGQFKRQRCLRYKHRKSRPILRSKSDISDRYNTRSPSPLTQLDAFFSRLGLSERDYMSLVPIGPNSPPSSPPPSRASPAPVVCSAVDGSPPTRISRPPSVVERNARIIKWLCQCRKVMPMNGTLNRSQ